MLTKSTRALAIEAMPLNPLQITVPGDTTTPAGHRYAGTYGNDFRQLEPWSATHELQLLHLFSTTRLVRLPYQDGMAMRYRLYNVPIESIAVFIQSVSRDEAEADGIKSYFDDGAGGFFNVVTDDGRQRRLDAAVGNRRLRWIGDQFVATIWRESKDATERRVALRNRLLEYGKCVYSDSVNKKSLPPREAAQPALKEGDVIAPWLTEAFVAAICDSRATWFDDAGEPVMLHLRADVRGEDVDLSGDHQVLLNNIRGKAASVPTSLAVKALQYKRLLETQNADGELIYTPHYLAQELGCSADTINNALYYLEIADEIREAVDADRVALKLCVTGRECICYGFTKEGKRSLLSKTEQLAIWGELLKAFSVEVSDGGIVDNAATRAILKKIKADILEGTAFVEGLQKRPRETKSQAAAAAAAAKVGLDTSALDDMAKPLSRVHEEMERAEEDSEGESRESRESTTSRTKKTETPTLSNSGIRASAPLSIRAALAVKAKMLKAQLSDFEATERDVDEDGLVLAVADAVAAIYEGTLKPEQAFARFPVLLEALQQNGGGATKRKKSTPPAVKRPGLPASPFSRDDKVKEIVDAALSLWEAEVGAAASEATGAVVHKGVAKYLKQAAIDVCGENVEAEIVMAATKRFDDVMNEYATKPRHDDVTVHIREALFT